MLKQIFSKVTTLTVMTLLILAGSLTASNTAQANSDYKRQIFSETNNYRSANGKSPVYASPHLNGIAQRWADHLARSGEYRHNPNLKAEIWATGGWSAAGENLVVQRADGYEAVKAWKESQGHRNNLLGNYNRIGIGVAIGGAYGSYYVQVFGNNSSDPSTNLYGAPLLPAPPTPAPPPTSPPPTNPPAPPAPPANNNGGGGGGGATTPPPAAEEPSGPSAEEIAAAERAAAEKAAAEQKKREEEQAKKKAEEEARKKKEAAEKELKQFQETQNKTLMAIQKNNQVRTQHAAEKAAKEKEKHTIVTAPTKTLLNLPERAQTFIAGNIQNTPLLAKNAGMAGGTLLSITGLGYLLNRKKINKLNTQSVTADPLTIISYNQFLNKAEKVTPPTYSEFINMESSKIASNVTEAPLHNQTHTNGSEAAERLSAVKESDIRALPVTPLTYSEFILK